MEKIKIHSASEKTVGRLSLYRRLLNRLGPDANSIYSHELAALAGITAAQVRRDFMSIGYAGSPTRGYDIRELKESIAHFLDAPTGQGAALIGVGNLGRAILSYFAGRRPNLSITAAFDKEPYKVNRVINGCRCYPIEDIPKVIAEKGIRVGILTVPSAEAQAMTDTLVRAGIKGLLNFAPIPLRVPADVYVADIDMTMALEKVAFFARQRALEHKEAIPS